MNQPSPANDDPKPAASQPVTAPAPTTEAGPEPATHIPLSKDLRDTALVLLVALPVVLYFVIGQLNEMASARDDRRYSAAAHEFTADDWQQLLEECEAWHARLWPLEEAGSVTPDDIAVGDGQPLLRRLGFAEVSMIEDVRIRFYEGDRAMKFVAAMPATDRPAIMRYRPLPSPPPELPDIGRELPWDIVHIDRRYLDRRGAGDPATTGDGAAD